MNNLLTIGFDFLEQSYLSLIRVKEKEGATEYQITVMNGELEKLLYGHHIIQEKNGYLQVEMPPYHDKQSVLRQTIANALSVFLKIPISEEVVETPV